MDSLKAPIETVSLQPQIESHPAPVSLNNIPASEIDSIMQGKWVLYYYGVISYEDIFGEIHSTKIFVGTDTRFQGLITKDKKYNVIE